MVRNCSPGKPSVQDSPGGVLAWRATKELASSRNALQPKLNLLTQEIHPGIPTRNYKSSGTWGEAKQKNPHDSSSDKDSFCQC
ncbi:hypothetical protein Y1Q_0009751 [Alligator mississippiensis]|uniref:Uncharacterized protein n=1 Tax=Alligator mississippiensis TaxID=8496 RepID=A0A151MWS4_ALLMI|nr:hypothetical protein Y1Q_0009751 [Alligator mississippiensis]